MKVRYTGLSDISDGERESSLKDGSKPNQSSEMLTQIEELRNSTKSCAVNNLRPKWSTNNKNWIPEQLWIQVKRHVPIPCVDIILENNKGQILLGWRCILPYRNVWALPGGRLLRGESLQAAVARVLDEYTLIASNLILVGVFPIRFRERSDVSICIAAKHAGGDAQPDGKEFTKFLESSN